MNDFILILGLLLQPRAAFVTPFSLYEKNILDRNKNQPTINQLFKLRGFQYFIICQCIFAISLFVSNFGENSTMVLEKGWKSEYITERCTDAQIDGKTNRQSDRWMDEQTKDNRWTEKLCLPYRLGELKYQHEQYVTWKSIDFFNRWNCKRVCIIKKSWNKLPDLRSVLKRLNYML